MEPIAIIGLGGAGKSTLTRQIGTALGQPVISGVSVPAGGRRGDPDA